MSKLKSMVDGNITQNLILFSIPIMLGNLFQVMYNTADTIIVGRFVGKDALAAVGATSPIINMLVGIFLGISSGAGVLISKKYGAKNDKDLSKAIHTFILMTLIMGIIISVVGIIATPSILRAINIPADIIDDSITYLGIYFMGALGLVFFNAASGILRAVGDSKRPLYYLMFASILNVVLDLLFVIQFQMGVSGVAWATFISQGLSAVLSLCNIRFTKKNYTFRFKSLRIDKDSMNSILRIGIPAGLQQAIISLSNVLVQSYINSFGSIAVAGYSAANKLDSLLVLPINSLALALTTFVGQNSGARKNDRIFKGVNRCLLIMIVCVAIIGIITYYNLELVLGFINKDPDVLYYGTMKMRILIPFYGLLGVNQLLIGALRGLSITKVPIFMNLFSFVVVRQLFLFTVMNLYNDIYYVFLNYAITWTISAALLVIYYLKGHWRHEYKYKM